MLGFNRKSRSAATTETEQQQGITDNQIPYEVYETVHGPVARRRRWTVRLAAILLAGALLVFGGISLRNKLNSNNPSANNPSATQGTQTGPGPNNTGQQTMNPASQQAPQSNAPLQKSESNPATTPQSEAVNTGTVNQPE